MSKVKKTLARLACLTLVLATIWLAGQRLLRHLQVKGQEKFGRSMMETSPIRGNSIIPEIRGAQA